METNGLAGAGCERGKRFQDAVWFQLEEQQLTQRRTLAGLGRCDGCMMLVQSRPIENTGLVATIVSPKSAQACLDFPLLSPNFGRFPIFANSNKATFEGTV